MAQWSDQWKKGKRRGQRFERRAFAHQVAGATVLGPTRIVCNTDAPAGNGRPAGTVRA
jgi:hypothetical protein